jgi:hypothetical protein
LSDAKNNGSSRGNGREAGDEIRDKDKDGSLADTGTAGAGAETKTIDYLTVEEEKILSDFFCLQLMNMATQDMFQFPTNVTVRLVLPFAVLDRL